MKHTKIGDCEPECERCKMDWRTAVDRIRIEEPTMRDELPETAEAMRTLLEEFETARAERDFFREVTKENDGPGTPLMRRRLLMQKLEERFPNPEPFRSDRVPEEHYIAVIDALIAVARKAKALAVMCSPSPNRPVEMGMNRREKLALEIQDDISKIPGTRL